jgi:hypothetical protein
MSESILITAIIMSGLVLCIIAWQVFSIGRDAAGRENKAGADLHKAVARLTDQVEKLNRYMEQSNPGKS